MKNFVLVHWPMSICLCQPIKNHLHHWSCPESTHKKAQNFAPSHPTVAAPDCARHQNIIDR